MKPGDVKYLEALRAKGIRVTPQRRAILGAFGGGPSEHLSAEVVHSRASGVLPELGRGTVYATLAELTEIGLLASVGSSDPVRYELNTSTHHHFHCLVCRRVHDVDIVPPDLEPLVSAGFEVRHAEVVADGTCSECIQYLDGLTQGTRRIRRTKRPFSALLANPELACGVDTDQKVGAFAVAATDMGLARLSFEEHADFRSLSERAEQTGGSRVAHEHLDASRKAISRFLDGAAQKVAVPIDWNSMLEVNVAGLRATNDIPYGELRSYTELLETSSDSSKSLGKSLGANPLPIVFPCHRVTRGREIPPDYVGGPDRREMLITLEQENARA